MSNPTTAGTGVKLIILIKKKDGLSPEDFRHHYETVHVPLCLSVTNRFASYVRYYVDPKGSSIHPTGNKADFDVVTEASFESQEVYEKFQEDMKLENENENRIAKDEMKFIKREDIQMFVVSEYKTQF